MEELERIQRRILERIAHLEFQLSLSSPSDDDDAANDATAERLSAILRVNGVNDFSFKVVPSDYYDRPLEARRHLLSAPSIHHLCKSIVLVQLLLSFVISLFLLITALLSLRFFN